MTLPRRIAIGRNPNVLGWLDQKRAEIGTINLRLQKLLDSFLDGVIEREDYSAEKTKLMSRKKSLQEQSTALFAEP